MKTLEKTSCTNILFNANESARTLGGPSTDIDRPEIRQSSFELLPDHGISCSIFDCHGLYFPVVLA